MHIDLKFFCFGQFQSKFFVFVEGNCNMFYGLLKAVIVEVGLAKVVVGYNKSEV